MMPENKAIKLSAKAKAKQAKVKKMMKAMMDEVHEMIDGDSN
jgi:hypothetical protein